MEALFIIIIDSRTLYTLSVGLQGMRALIRTSTGLCSHSAPSCLHLLAFPPFLGHRPVSEHLLRARGKCRVMLLRSNKVSMSPCACISVVCVNGCIMRGACLQWCLHVSVFLCTTVSMCHCICWGCHNQIPWAEWIKQQTFIFSQFWRLDVHDQGASKFGFFMRTLFLACRQPPSHCVLMWPFVCTCRDTHTHTEKGRYLFHFL